jgi:hypothetical protein
MPIYKIQAPDGMIRKVESDDPDRAAQAVMAEYTERSAKAKQEYDPTAGMSTAEKALAGIGSGFANKGLGIQQFVNAISGGLIGDKDKLNAEVAEKKRLDRPLTGGGLTSVGGASEAVGELLPDLLMGGPFAMGRTAAAKMLPSAAAKWHRYLGAAGAAAGEGALQNATTAAENYDLKREAGQGAVFGMGGEAVGRAVGRAASPFRSLGPSETAAQHYRVLEGAGIPAPIAQNMTDSPNVARFTHALAQLPVFNRNINSSHNANLEWFTQRKTAPTGSRMKELTPDNTEAVEQRLGNTAKAFRAGPDVPLTNVPTDLANLHAGGSDSVMAMGGNQNRLNSLMTNALAQPTYTANAIMDARQKLSNQQQGHRMAGRYFEADQARALKEIYEDALKATHPDGGAAFDLWKKQHGAWADVANAASEGGGKTARVLEPTEFAAKNLDERRRLAARPGSADAFTNAAANRIPKLPNTENRAWITAMLMGTPLIAGGGGWLFGDKDLGLNAAATTAIPAGGLFLASQLLGTKGGGKYLLGKYRGQGEKARDLYRELLTAAAQQAHD